MEPRQSPRERVSEVALAVGPAIREQARRRWGHVHTAERNERGRHVWRFRSDGGAEDLFLHIEHKAMLRGVNPAQRLLKRLAAGDWLDRLQDGSESALLLSRDGQLVPLPARG
jgi:hypothetical protein